jgi:DNA-directed RNA polymerase specialized sigma24 family protein
VLLVVVPGKKTTCKKERCTSEGNRNSAAREMEHVLSRRLRAFYRNAYRFLDNTADVEDAVQDAPLSKHLNQSRGQAQMST